MTDETTTVEETDETTTAAETETTERKTVTMPRQEADALRRKLAEAERDRRKLEADQRKADEKRQEEEGQHQQLAEQRGRELEAEREKGARVEREARITRLAGRLNFLDPADVIGRVTADEGADDVSVENALSRIAQQSPHLVQKETPPRPEIGEVHSASATTMAATTTQDGKPAPPAGKAPLNSLDEWEALPQAERGARMAEADWLVLNEK